MEVKRRLTVSWRVKIKVKREAIEAYSVKRYKKRDHLVFLCFAYFCVIFGAVQLISV